MTPEIKWCFPPSFGYDWMDPDESLISICGYTFGARINACTVDWPIIVLRMAIRHEKGH